MCTGIRAAALALAISLGPVAAELAGQGVGHLEPAREALSLELDPSNRDALASLFPRWPS